VTAFRSFNNNTGSSGQGCSGAGTRGNVVPIDFFCGNGVPRHLVGLSLPYCGDIWEKVAV